MFYANGKTARSHRIVAVPTPINGDHTPNLAPVESASRIVGQNLEKGSIVVFESTVYPGVTEEVCVPILEAESGLKCGVDFKVGYSPERINPGDKVHRLENIVKIVSGMDDETLDIVAKVYELVVGGHCVGVDPYYLTYRAEQLGYQSQVILASRRINDDMGRYVAQNVVKKLIAADIPVKNARVAILGFTFKENCPDTRNTRVIDIYRELQEYGITPLVCDPAADAAEAERLYGIRFVPMAEIRDMDAVILAVAHDCFKKLTIADLDRFYSEKHRKVLVDVKAMLDKRTCLEAGYLYWRL